MERTSLLEKLNMARPCLSTQDIVPILSHFCFTDEEIIAFNGIQGIIIDYEDAVTIENCGLPGELLIKLLSSYSSDKMAVNQKGNEVNIKIGKSNAKLACLPEADFIFEIPDIDDLPSFTLSEDFLMGIKKTLISVSKNSLQRNQFGITLVSDKKGAHLYSTDNQRISRYSLEKTLGKKSIKMLLPEVFCRLILDISKELNDTSAELYFSEDFIFACFEGVYVYTKLLTEVDYLDYEAVIEAHWDEEENEFQEIPENLLTAIERTTLLTSKETDQIVHLDSEEETLLVSGKSGYGAIKESIVFEEDISEEEISCRMDANHILDILQAVDEIAFCYSTGEDSIPMLAGKSDSFFHLVMGFKDE